MNTTLDRTGGASPFDSIRSVNEQGVETWSARDLQTLTNYARWENFEVPLNRAMRAAENVGMDVTSNFLRSQKINGNRPLTDYDLTRFAAYLVAMNGDPNKPEIAAAQAYFAVRTREAEVAQQPAQTVTVVDPVALVQDLVSRAAAAEGQLAQIAALLSGAQPQVAPSVRPLGEPSTQATGGVHLPHTLPAPPTARSETALVQEWVQRCCGAHAMGTSSRKLYTAFSAWARAHADEVPTETRFGMALTELGYPAWKMRTANYRGLAVMRR